MGILAILALASLAQSPPIPEGLPEREAYRQAVLIVEARLDSVVTDTAFIDSIPVLVYFYSPTITRIWKGQLNAVPRILTPRPGPTGCWDCPQDLRPFPLDSAALLYLAPADGQKALKILRILFGEAAQAERKRLARHH